MQLGINPVSLYLPAPTGGAHEHQRDALHDDVRDLVYGLLDQIVLGPQPETESKNHYCTSEVRVKMDRAKQRLKRRKTAVLWFKVAGLPNSNFSRKAMSWRTLTRENPLPR